MQRTKQLMLVILIFAALQMAACRQASVTADKIEPAQVEAIEGSDLKRVILTERAAERIDLQTAPVTEEMVIRQQRVGGQLVSAGALSLPDAGVVAQISLSASELERIDQSQPVRVLPLSGDATNAVTAQLAQVSSASASNARQSLYYTLDSQSVSLTEGQRIYAELTLLGSGQQRLVVPYAAVIYDTTGQAWVYTNPEPLVFVREPITVDYIEGNRAILNEGPAVGTAVVTVGGSLLFGAETGVSK